MKNNDNWKSQLSQIKTDMRSNMTEEEKNQEKLAEQERQRNYKEINKRKPVLYEFLAGYKQNSGIFINNFFRNRDYETYCKDKFHVFDFDISGIMPNVFDNPYFSFQMVNYLSKLEENKIAYHPINMHFIRHLIAFSEVLDYSESLEEDFILYRGCSTLERNGVSGIVSATVDKKIAEQFSRGTILTIHVPKGTKYLDVKSIRPKEQRRKDIEQEFLLPPCDYEIISEKEVTRGREPNNITGRTKLIELRVKPLNLLEEFLKQLEKPPKEYEKLREIQGLEYEETKLMLKNYLENKNNKVTNNRKNAAKIKKYTC